MKKIQTRFKIDERGSSHIIMPLLLIVALAVGGTYVRTMAAADSSKPIEKRQPIMRTLASVSADQKKINGYEEVKIDGFSFTKKYCSGSVHMSYSNGQKTLEQNLRLKYINNKENNNGNGYCVGIINKKLAAGTWSITSSFKGNKYLKSAVNTESVSVILQPPVKTKAKAKAALAPQYKVASYNVLGASHTAPGGNDNGKHAGWAPRAVKLVGIIQSNTFDIVGMQELESEQRSRLLELTNNSYDIYPSPANYADGASTNSIIWKRSKFTLLDSGMTSMPYLNGNTAKAPWVKLKSLDNGQQFFVLNAHYPTSNDGKNETSKIFREQDAKIHLADAESKINTGLPVIVTGDFNSAYIVRNGDFADRSRLVYCILTSSGKLRNASDAVKSISGRCPTNSGGWIDHVYVSDKVTVSSVRHLSGSDVAYASDHRPVVATLRLK